MHESSDLESYGDGHRTFDCPWCGAISGIARGHLGDKFECPECHESTKLTPENAPRRHITDAPPDAPHHPDLAKPAAALHEVSELEAYGKDARTFDCPWCGAIASIDPSHLGESFTCPECHKATKLTDENTRSAPPTEAPEDAPVHADSNASKVPLLVGLAVLLVAAGIAFAVLGGGGTEDGDGGGERASVVSDSTEPADPADPAATDVTPSPLDPANPGEEASPVEADPPAEPSAADLEAQARDLLEQAELALATWEQEHAQELEAARLRDAADGLAATATQRYEALESEAVTPSAVRAFNKEFRSFVGADPLRVQIVEYVLVHMNRDGVRPVHIASWDEMNFYDPRVRELLLEACAKREGPDLAERAELVSAVDAAKAELARVTSNGG